MKTGWKTTAMQRAGDGVSMFVSKWLTGGWSASVYASHDWQTVGHSVTPSSGERFETSMDAIDAAELYVARLGPVEPVMLLVAAFARSQDWTRRAHKEAA
jgi:hypothetical protein